jgi:RES domain-containing protein
MNPPGIAYFYLALEPETAIAEAIDKPPCYAAVAEFEATQQFLVLDLTELPPSPSIFDSEHSEVRQGLLFLDRFIEAIAIPVTKDGREHVDYIPSQVICEFFAQIFRVHGRGQLDGILYPSAVRPGGKNLVILPPRDISERWEDRVKLMNISHRGFHNWEELKKAI